MDIYSFVFLFVFIPSFLFFNKISVQSFIFVILWFSINCLFDFFLYEKRPVSLRRSFRFSTEIVPFLYDDRLVSLRVFLRLFPIFYTRFFSLCLFLPVLSKSLPFHLKYLLLPLSFLSFFFFFLSRAFICARIYYNVPPFSLPFSSFHFYVLQHLCKSASYKKVSFLFQNNS